MPTGEIAARRLAKRSLSRSASWRRFRSVMSVSVPTIQPSGGSDSRQAWSMIHAVDPSGRGCGDSRRAGWGASAAAGGARGAPRGGAGAGALGGAGVERTRPAAPEQLGARAARALGGLPVHVDAFPRRVGAVDPDRRRLGEGVVAPLA